MIMITKIGINLTVLINTISIFMKSNNIRIIIRIIAIKMKNET